MTGLTCSLCSAKDQMDAFGGLCFSCSMKKKSMIDTHHPKLRESIERCFGCQFFDVDLIEEMCSYRGDLIYPNCYDKGVD